ncbi:MAG TPA: protein kinase [Kofleriaceae bacterium]|nr:protein kinase [Kofleriaceae bacterium]
MEQFGKYTLIRRIGTGGMAEVFLARTTVAQGLNKTLVIKKIHTAYARSKQFVSMFVDEAKIALGLNHPNIIQVFDFGAVGETFFLAMEYVEGMDLLRLLQEAARARLRLPYGLSAYIVQQISKGLDYAHRKTDEFGEPLGIVHRDISPQNILLSWDGGVKIVDFGIARARDVHEEQGVIKGKFAYMSPEQARGELVDCRSDVFAAGIVLFELACARPLFNGKGKEALEMVKSGAIPRPRDHAPEIPETLEQIILKALAFHREDRYQTARDLQRDLGRFQLEWAQRTGAITDSGVLAQQLATLAPDQRVAAPRPPAEGGSGGPSHLPRPSDDGTDPPHTPPASPAASRLVKGSILDALGPPSAAPDAALSIPEVALSIPGVGLSSPDVALSSPGAALSVPGAALGGPGAAPGGPDASAEPPRRPGEPARPRERKYVYVLQGIVRGTASLERRLGAADAGRLVHEFYQVARDVAFKHDALLDLPRADPRLDPRADGKEPGDAAGPTPAPFTSIGANEVTIRAVVGLPVAGEDDASRAIKLALALVDALDGIGSDVEPELRLAIAVQRGAALVRRTEAKGDAPLPTTFEVEEATAAFAYKLARQARGAEVLVGGRVYRAARAEWNFEPLPAIDLAEDPAVRAQLAGPIDEDTDPGVKRARVYRLRGPKERAERIRARSAGRLHGRELELKALRDAWRDVLVTRRKRQVMIVGDAGVGKRTLVRAFLEGLQPREAVVIRTTGRVGTAMTPYAVIADLSRDVLGLAENAEPHEVERRLLRALPLVFPGEEASSREARSALQLMGMLLGGRAITLELPGPPGAPPPEDSFTADTRRRTLIRLLGRIEQRLETDKPLIYLGEDVHWADQDSQELFAALLQRETARPIFGLLTSRPEPRILKLAKELGTEIIHLDELSGEDLRQLLAERFVPGHDIDELAQQIAARAGGNAFFIQELLDSLIERGILVAEQDGEHPGLLRWVKRDAPIHVPSTVEDLLLTRIDTLPPAEKDTLVHAAVLGRHVTAVSLAPLLGRPVRLELDELVRRGLLSPSDGEYRFKNDMIMTVAYGLVPFETRAQLHRALAARIENASGYRPGQDDAVIARHLELAGDGLEAADRYTRAAGHAIEIGGNADAFRQLSRALKLVPAEDHERRFAIHRQREEILRRLAKRPQQLRELHAMRKAAEVLAQPGKLAHAHAALAQFYIDVGKAPAALRAVTPALAHARAAGDVLLEAEALRLRASIARLVGNAEESLRLAEQALALCDSAAATAPGDAGRPPTPVLLARATILNQRGTTLWNMGRLEAAIESYAEALVIYRAIGMARHEARALNNMGIVFAALGEYEEALAHYKSALKLDQALGERSGLALKLGNIGQCYADLGDTARAESYLAKALSVAEQTGDLSAASDAAVSWGQAKLARGELRAALELFERGLALATENRERYQEVRALEYIALAHLAAGDPPEAALEMARSATEWARKMPMLVGIIYGLTFQALALSKLGHHPEAITAIDEAVAKLEGARPEGAEYVYAWQAEILAAAGRPAESRAATARAAAEISAKAAKLRDPELRQLFLGSRRLPGRPPTAPPLAPAPASSAAGPPGGPPAPTERAT